MEVRLGKPNTEEMQIIIIVIYYYYFLYSAINLSRLVQLATRVGIRRFWSHSIAWRALEGAVALLLRSLPLWLVQSPFPHQ